MQIAILGSGSVGRALGARWSKAAHDVVYGVRNQNSRNVQELERTAGNRVRITDEKAAVDDADIVVLALPFRAVEAVLETVGLLRDRLVIDCTNPIGVSLDSGFDSGAEQIAAQIPESTVVKAFNTTGANNMANSEYPDGAPTMFVAGDDTAAKHTVGSLAEELGFDICDTGPLAASKHLERMALFWIHLAGEHPSGRDIAFRLLDR